MARPRKHETRQRTHAFMASLVELGDFAAAASAANLDAGRVLRLLREEEFRAVAIAVLEGRLGPTAVIVDTNPNPVADVAA